MQHRQQLDILRDIVSVVRQERTLGVVVVVTLFSPHGRMLSRSLRYCIQGTALGTPRHAREGGGSSYTTAAQYHTDLLTEELCPISSLAVHTLMLSWTRK